MIILLLSPIYIFIIYLFRNNFIGNKILYIKVDGVKMGEPESNELLHFLFSKRKTNKINYLNDSFMFKLEEKNQVFKIKVETLLIESVFIGALTFGTYVQITSPESIQSFEQRKQEDQKDLDKFDASRKVLIHINNTNPTINHFAHSDNIVFNNCITTKP